MAHTLLIPNARFPLLFLILLVVHVGTACRASEPEPVEQLRQARQALNDCLVEHYTEQEYCDIERLEAKLIADEIAERLGRPSMASTPPPAERDWIPLEVTGTSGVLFTGQLGSGPGSQTVSGSIPTYLQAPPSAGHEPRCGDPEPIELRHPSGIHPVSIEL